MAEWYINAEYVEACNCDVGCSCNTTGFPTDGTCHGTVAFRVTEGERDGIDLSGVKVAAGVMWPGAIHEGNGSMVVFVDAETDEQREAIVNIMTGQDGGLPWELLAATVSDINGPYFEPIEFIADGVASSVRVGDKLQVELQSLVNPVTGEPNEAHTVLPNGFIWKDGLMATSSHNQVNSDGVAYTHPGNSAYYSEVEWSNRKAPAMATA